MNKTAIKNFAIWARNKLRADIILKAGLLGITDKEIANPLPQSTNDLQIFDIGTSQPVRLEGKTAIDQRKSLVAAIRAKNLKHPEAFDAVIEEVAYTWFNRLIAVRFMEVNDYLPSRVRVLSSENPAKAEPDFVTNPFDTDLEFTPAELDLIDDLKDHNKSDELFQFLFIKQCNKLNEILPELFEKTNDYTELLLNVSFTDKDGVVWHLIHDISEDDFNVEKEGQVEIIGWLYQYYNTELNDLVYNGSYSKSKIKKELVPAATTIYTPDWAIRYMVENSLGRIAIHNLKYGDWNDTERAKIDTFKTKWKYYLEEAEQSQEIIDRFRFEESNRYNGDESPYVNSTFLDPCMGSGHILVYAFDVFMDIYTAQGYTERDAAQRIVEKNLYGLELDDRATQLAYFAVMMKARSYDRRFLTRGIRPNLCSIQESNNLNTSCLELFGNLKSTAQKLVNEFIDAKEYGSILKLSITFDEITELEIKFNEIAITEFDNLYDSADQTVVITTFAPLIRQAKIMLREYEVVCTNPPYLGSSRFNPKLDKYVKNNYSEVKSDLSMVMYQKSMSDYSQRNGYIAFITTSSWMFLSSFEKLRNTIQSKTITTLVDFGTELFDGKVGHNPIVSWVTLNHYIDIEMKAIRLVEYCYARRGQKREEFFNSQNTYTSHQSNFSKIPGSPIAYWVNDKLLKDFELGENLKIKGDTRQGMATSDNNRFLRQWYEVSLYKIGLNCQDADEALRIHKKWYPYNKGGEFRKWYGNISYTINYENDGKEVKEYATSLYKTPSRTIKSMSEYFKENISWSKISSGSVAFRYYPKGFVFDVAGCCIFYRNESDMYYDFGFLNSKVSKAILSVISPTLNYEAGHISTLPVIRIQDKYNEVISIVHNNIDISKKDWDSFETSWDFEEHPFIRWAKGLWDCTSIAASMDCYYGGHPKVSCPLELCYMLWQGECNDRFEQLKANEEELNRIFIDIYGLQDELTPDIKDDKDITVRTAEKQRDMRSFVSYAVGCMFGRYSLDIAGLAYAGGDWDNEKYKSFVPDDDNCIPITDTAYFEDDIVGRFCEFVKVVYGEDTLEANLEYVAKALGNKGNTSRDIIRNYFLNDFFKDHCKIYQKRPIYWLFDSGKQNGFKALVYMHRWNADTIGNMRVEYLHRIQRTYEKEIEREQDTIDNTTNNRDRAAATKRKEKLQKQLKEAKDYDAKVAHLALSRPDIDLDDGVKVNYEKVQTSQDGKKLQILAKI